MLKLDNIEAGYDRAKVLHGINLETRNDGIYSILGHNGAGKSTMLRTAVGLIKPTQGSVYFDGKDVTNLAPNKRVAMGMAYVPQGQLSFEQLTTMENLQVVADLQGRGKSKKLVNEALERFPALEAVLTRRAGLLSGGQRQQLAIARALITQPKFLILDEPAEGIQPSVVAEIEEAIVNLAKEGMSILLVEQHVGFAVTSAHTYGIMAAGKITQTGPGGADSQTEVREALTI